MARGGRTEVQFASPAVLRQAALLGTRVRQARVARGWTQAELAERSRVSAQTMRRIEHGNVAVALGAWLGVLERVGLIETLMPASDAMALARAAAHTRARPRSKPDPALDF
jgi:transcriptional regulator with XRE-family HTH domain